MVDNQQFMMENRERILAVENSFSPGGKPLLVPGRVLIGEGRLLKLCRRKPQPKAFYLFNDILVYGSIVVPGRWNSNQHILHLEELEQENLEDGVGMRNQWVLRTPHKSFHISAESLEEKRAWMEHIESCRVERLKRLGLLAVTKPFAAIWIPDTASAACMRAAPDPSTSRSADTTADTAASWCVTPARTVAPSSNTSHPNRSGCVAPVRSLSTSRTTAMERSGRRTR